MKPAALQGLRTVIYFVGDMERARAWYRSLLGIEPYFDQPFYIGFNVGGFELGLHPANDTHPAGAGGQIAYWGVETMATAWARVTATGVTPVEQPEDVGGGILVASVRDPFGNLLGLIENPNFPNTA
ncbi:MAG: VOC family protein [Candidatus Eisenbacteria bacterium]|nr:VOC family protein [Candidatus Eisenbacteria bacterium]